MEWILILFLHAGAMSDHDSMAVTNVPGFKSEQECKNAGDASSRLVSRTFKEVRFVCVSRTKN